MLGLDEGVWTALAAIGTWLASIVALFIALFSHFTAKAQRERILTIKASHGYIPVGPSADLIWTVLVEVSNTASFPVHIGLWRMKLPDRRTMQFMDDAPLLPVFEERGEVTVTGHLPPGTTAKYAVEMKRVVEGLRSNGYRGKLKCRFEVHDHKDHRYRTKPFRIDADTKKF